MIEKQKVAIYVLKDEKLLVFRHTDFSYEEVGIQIPAGSIKEGESLKAAALRELQEETGYAGIKIVSSLGVHTYNKMPQKPEIHIRHFFQAEPTEPLPERWLSHEKHDGLQEPTNFECFWIPLAQAHLLEAGFGSLLYALK